jgi:phosphatidylcholine synthase
MAPRKSSKLPEQSAAPEKTPGARDSVSRPARVIGLAIHVFTAVGAAAGLMALTAAFQAQFPAMFFWLAVALVIDGIDGTFARLARVSETAPEYDGAVLDLVVDYLNYVLVPVVGLWRSGLMPEDLALGLGILVMVTSSLYFADRRMKMSDNFFRGFPALWNVVALYLFVFRLPGALNACVIVLLCGLMFLPVPFLHPMRVKRMQAMSVAFTCLWFGSAGLAVTQGLNTNMFAKGGLIASALYFLFASVLRGRLK